MKSIRASMMMAASLAVTFAALAAPAALAQDGPYPSRPIRMVVGFAPGGGTDVVARLIAPSLAEKLGQSVVVENRAGASGIVGAGMVAKSPPDGYTLMMGVVSLNTVIPSLFKNLPYDPVHDFVPISLVASVPHFVVVHPSLPVHSLKELIDYAKRNPGTLSFPSAGSGTTPHLAGEMFKSMAGVDLLHVPYKSTGQSMPDLLGGTHRVAFDTYPTVASYVRSGKLRALAVTGAQRLADFPDLPTVAEAGLPGYRMSTWYGVFAPKGMPAAIVERLHGDIVRTIQAPEVRNKLVEIGVDGTMTRTPADFAELVRSDTERYARVVKEANIKVE